MDLGEVKSSTSSPSLQGYLPARPPPRLQHQQQQQLHSPMYNETHESGRYLPSYSSSFGRRGDQGPVMQEEERVVSLPSMRTRPSPHEEEEGGGGHMGVLDGPPLDGPPMTTTWSTPHSVHSVHPAYPPRPDLIPGSWYQVPPYQPSQLGFTPSWTTSHHGGSYPPPPPEVGGPFQIGPQSGHFADPYFRPSPYPHHPPVTSTASYFPLRPSTPSGGHETVVVEGEVEEEQQQQLRQMRGGSYEDDWAYQGPPFGPPPTRRSSAPSRGWSRPTPYHHHHQNHHHQSARSQFYPSSALPPPARLDFVPGSPQGGHERGVITSAYNRHLPPHRPASPLAPVSQLHPSERLSQTRQSNRQDASFSNAQNSSIILLRPPPRPPPRQPPSTLPPHPPHPPQSRLSGEPPSSPESTAQRIFDKLPGVTKAIEDYMNSPLHTHFTSKVPELAAELELRVAQFGGQLDDLMGLFIPGHRPSPPPPGGSTSKARRGSLSDGVPSRRDRTKRQYPKLDGESAKYEAVDAADAEASSILRSIAGDSTHVTREEG